MTSLTLTHARFQLLETVRIPIALVGSAFFPAASMLFFVVPFTGDDPVGSPYATAAMVTVAVMTTNLFQYGLAGLVMMLISLIPVIVIAALLTEATVTPAQFLLAAGTTAVVAVPFILMGLGIGYSMPSKAAIVVAQVLFFPLAFGGGLMTPPGTAPGFVEDIAPFLPTGGAVRLMWAAVGDFPIDVSSVLTLVGWTVVLAGLAVWAYRRDEGRRFS